MLSWSLRARGILPALILMLSLALLLIMAAGIGWGAAMVISALVSP